MFDLWNVLHLDEVESENILFCHALEREQFAGRCESVQSIDAAKHHLEQGLYKPQKVARPDIIVVDWKPDCDDHVLELVYWVRIQPQLHATPVIVFVESELPLPAREQAQRAGVTELMVRPDTFGDLLTQVRTLLEHCMHRCVVRPYALAG